MGIAKGYLMGRKGFARVDGRTPTGGREGAGHETAAALDGDDDRFRNRTRARIYFVPRVSANLRPPAPPNYPNQFLPRSDGR